MNIIKRKEAISLGLDFYFTGKPCKHGHVSKRRCRKGECVECESIRGKTDKVKEYKKNHYIKNKDKYAKRGAERRAANHDEYIAYGRNHYKENKAQYRENFKRWRSENLDKVMPYERLNATIRRMLSLAKKGNDDVFIESVGYTSGEFRLAIESKFKVGMTWGNHGRGANKWQVDHILPKSLFINNGIDDDKIISSLDNLQPLWSQENASKGSRIDGA